MDMHHHEDLLNGFIEQQRAVLENSHQGVYIFLDDMHKVCNRNFSDMLGLSSPDEFARLPTPLMIVAEEDGSQAKLVIAFQDAMSNLNGGSFDLTWIKKSGDQQKTHVILVPIAYQGHLAALHFVALPLM